MAMDEAVGNIKHKDRLFCYLFGSEENKAWTLSLYNAVNKSSYTDPSAIEITTIKDILYMGIHNDVSFVVSDEMNVYEQQSTYNPNMPFRMIEYVVHLFGKHIKQTRQNKFGKKQMTLPAPRLVVFYNGKDDQPEEVILKLSDSFPEGSHSDVEVKARMINVNYGNSKDLMGACKPLKEYSWLVEEVRVNNASNGKTGVGSAIDQAIRTMPDDFVIKPFLEAHRAEVKGMLMEEYNEIEQRELIREEIGEEERSKERVNNILSLMETLKLTSQQAMDALKIPVSDQPMYMSML